MNQASAEEILNELRVDFERAAAPYSRRESALLAVLHAAQDKLSMIGPETEKAVADFLGMGVNRVHEAVSFYTLFRTYPTGKYHLRVCRTLSCELCGAAGLLEAVRNRLKIREGQVTPDGLFSLEAVECLGCCDKSPALQINLGEYIGPLTQAGVVTLINELAEKEGRSGA